MDKINMRDKFFHGVMFDSSNLHLKLKTLRQILESGYILSPVSQGVESRYGDNIYLSVYPFGDYSNIYKGDGYFCSTTAFEMTSRTFYFILDSKLKDDYEIKAGSYPEECIIESKIDLYKYLVGIGNAGINIHPKAKVCYYLNQYMKNEIDFDEVVMRLHEVYFFGDVISAVAEASRIMSTYNVSTLNCINFVRNEEENKLIRYENYFDLKKLIDEVNPDIKLYDNSGCLVSDAIGKEVIRDIKKRINESYFSDRDYAVCAKDIYTRVKHN